MSRADLAGDTSSGEIAELLAVSATLTVDEFARHVHECGGPPPGTRLGCFGTSVHAVLNRIAAGDDEAYVDPYGSMLVALDDWHRLEDYLGYEPEGSPRRRKSHLPARAAVAMYDAQSFLTYRHGLALNTHLTLDFGLMGMVDHREGPSLMADFNKEVRRYLSVNGDLPRERRGPRLRHAHGAGHYWMYSLELGAGTGQHAHQLCVIPTDQIKEFRAFAVRWWSKAAMLDLDEQAVHVAHRTPRGFTGPYQRQAAWFRYIAKSCEPGHWVRKGKISIMPLEKALRLRHPGHIGETYSAHAYGICRALSQKSQAAVGFVSNLRLGLFDHLYSGWEVPAYLFRSDFEADFANRTTSW